MILSLQVAPGDTEVVRGIGAATLPHVAALLHASDDDGVLQSCCGLLTALVRPGTAW